LAAERVEILGTPIDFLDIDSVADRIVCAARQRRFFQVATVNLDFLVHSQSDPEVRAVLCETAVNIADGAPVVWAGRLVGHREASRVAGADLVPLLMSRAAEHGLRVFFLGGEDGSAFDAAERLRDAHPALDVTVMEPPLAALDQMDDRAILDQVESAAPHLLLVALGHPKQEKWIYRNRRALPMVAVGVGCSLDLIAGRQNRAPRWIQKVYLEWAYRLVHEPRRLAKRYAVDALWLVRDLFPWALTQRFGSAG
jgi:N-acetylglucosaminyldiphosphoundecaprenol N-acetyl-beta-D-mannosaminyltransferase